MRKRRTRKNVFKQVGIVAEPPKALSKSDRARLLSVGFLGDTGWPSIRQKGRYTLADDVFKKIDRVRKPRVHIKYDVYIGDATEKKELPFVVGVLGDFSGNPTAPLKELSKRNFVTIDRDNFNDVMAKMTPGANFRVENTLKGDGTEFSVALKFNSIEDFEPAKVANQVEPLRKLLETREKLGHIMARADRYEDLEKLLEEVLKNADQITKVSTALASNKPASTEDKGDKS